jgi:hypothetical protein
VLRSDAGTAGHVLAEQRHPGGAIRLLQPPAGGQGGAAIEDPDVVSAKKTALEHVAARGVLTVHPPGEVQQQPREALLRKWQIYLAETGLHVLQEEGREGVHGGLTLAVTLAGDKAHKRAAACQARGVALLGETALAEADRRPIRELRGVNQGRLRASADSVRDGLWRCLPLIATVEPRSNDLGCDLQAITIMALTCALGWS